jgi:hypothetical protein
VGNLFTFGGADSFDKHRRIEGVSWWPEELPNKKEEDYGLVNLEKVGNKVDYIITHDSPIKISNDYNNDYSLRKYLEFIREKVSFKTWYFGHYHLDKEFIINKNQKAICLYDKILKIK